MRATLRRLCATATALAMMLLVTSLVTDRGAAASAGSSPDAWATTCSAARLGLGQDVVARAPVLKGDTAPGGGPVREVAAADGTWYPIVLVHGWTSRDSVADPTDRTGAFSHLIDLSDIPGATAHTTRSLLGQLQSLPGAAVFTFDYHPYSARWVDDDHLGPALGKVIDCLYEHSGQKVILLGHSMGGLVARWAATHPGVTGSDRSGEISTVVTFGTPETGSIAALLAQRGVDLGAATDDALAVIRLILSTCGAMSSAEIRTGTVCDVLPAPIRTFESAAGIALRSGSPQLDALRPWPAGITVDALAGNTSFEVPKLGWFHWPWVSDRVTGAGDMIVTEGSATSDADTSRSATCSYQLNAVRGATDRLGLVVGLTAHSDVASLPFGAFAGPCFHTSLMRDIQLTNEALGAVNDDLTSRGPPTYAELLSAPVPACGHRGGRLTNGIQLGVPVQHGDTRLAWQGRDERTRDELTAFGDFNGDGTPDAATLLNCNAGGVPWPQMLVLYTHAPGGGLSLIGHAFLSDFRAAGHEAGENATARLLRTDGTSLHLEFSTQDEGDAAAWANLDYVATVLLRGGRLTTSAITAYTEQPTVDAFIAALRRGDTAAAGRLAAVGVATEASALLQHTSEPYGTTPTCRGLNDFLLEGPAAVGALVDQGGPDQVDAATTDRLCYLTPSPGAYVVLGMHHLGFRSWQVSWVREVTG